MSTRSSLSDRQIREIIRLRAAGVEKKLVARAVGCTPPQVAHYWQQSALYKSRGVTRNMRRRRLLLQMRRLNAARWSKKHEQERLTAAAVLAAEVKAAREEAATMQPFKAGKLSW